ncbi:ck1 family protein kinase [Stylonychia lemnae]|uniref:Casein kinase I n=1 Tax=Stylonychia lemnae TaxID=5949 RepID=A0A078BBB3_STYLE|nr:ck1 family protein kinase [Stylonychia lemnae]|eukprot:CDW90547.1 ck1 family protein kinase [Stylonychia lemnae]
MIDVGLVIDDKYSLVKKIGQGSQAAVWSAIDEERQIVAIKFLRSNGQMINGMYFIVMGKLGKSLQDIIQERQEKFSMLTVLQIGVQLVFDLEQLHNTGYTHYDIKPDNILLECDDFEDCGSSLVCLIDFGISLSLQEAAPNQEPALDNSNDKQKQRRRLFNGNIAFSSANQMLGKQIQRADDIVSILYLMIYLSEGRLPWSNQKITNNQYDSFRKVRQIKQQMQAYLERLLKHTHQLKDPNNIDYAYYISELTQANPNSLKSFSWVMDWTQPNDNWYNSYSEKEYIFKNFLSRNKYYLKAKGNQLLQTKKSLTQKNLYQAADRKVISTNMINSDSIQKQKQWQVSPDKPKVKPNRFFNGIILGNDNNNNINPIIKQDEPTVNNSQVSDIVMNNQIRARTLARISQQDMIERTQYINQMRKQTKFRQSMDSSNQDLGSFLYRLSNIQQINRDKTSQNRLDLESQKSQTFQLNLKDVMRANRKISNVVLANDLGDLQFSQNNIEHYLNIASQCFLQEYITIIDDTCIQIQDVDEDFRQIEVLRNQYYKYTIDYIPKGNDLKLIMSQQ